MKLNSLCCFFPGDTLIPAGHTQSLQTLPSCFPCFSWQHSCVMGHMNVMLEGGDQAITKARCEEPQEDTGKAPPNAHHVMEKPSAKWAAGPDWRELQQCCCCCAEHQAGHAQGTATKPSSPASLCSVRGRDTCWHKHSPCFLPLKQGELWGTESFPQSVQGAHNQPAALRAGLEPRVGRVPSNACAALLLPQGMGRTQHWHGGLLWAPGELDGYPEYCSQLGLFKATHIQKFMLPPGYFPQNKTKNKQIPKQQQQNSKKTKTKTPKISSKPPKTKITPQSPKKPKKTRPKEIWSEISSVLKETATCLLRGLEFTFSLWRERNLWSLPLCRDWPNKQLVLQM